MNWRAAFLWASLLCVGCGKGAELVPIYFGHVATLTGSGKEAGEQAARGIRIGLRELNQDPKARPFHVRHADAQGNPAAFEALAVRLTAVNHTAALYGGDNPDQVAKLARAEAIVMSPAGHRPPGLGELVYTIGLSPKAQGQALARFVRDELKRKAWLIILDDSSEEATLLARSFEESLTQFDDNGKAVKPSIAKIAFREAPDWRKQSDPFPRKNADAVLFAGTEKDLAIYLAALKTKEDIVTLSGESFVPPVEAAGKRTVFRPSSYWLDESRPVAAEFAKTYRETFKGDPTGEAALAYEGMLLLGQAFREAPQLTLEKVTEALNNTTDFPGLLGTLSFAKDQQIRRPVAIVRWSGMAASAEKIYPAEK